MRYDRRQIIWAGAMRERRVFTVDVECYAGHLGEQTPRTPISTPSRPWTTTPRITCTPPTTTAHSVRTRSRSRRSDRSRRTTVCTTSAYIATILGYRRIAVAEVLDAWLAPVLQN